MDKIKRAVRMMNIVRIIAVVLIIASAILYFKAREYALYPAVAGFAMIALVNLPLNIWLAFKREKQRKEKIEKYDREDKNRKTPAQPVEERRDEPVRYENRKSGLKWGGGNVHAANAERKSRRKFLR